MSFKLLASLNESDRCYLPVVQPISLPSKLLLSIDLLSLFDQVGRLYRPDLINHEKETNKQPK